MLSEIYFLVFKYFNVLVIVEFGTIDLEYSIKNTVVIIIIRSRVLVFYTSH